MCPSVAILAGGAGTGGGSGKGPGDGDGSAGAGTGGGGENATADARGAPDYSKYPECGYASHPVDVVTGRAFTHPITDLSLPGPLPLEIKRMYSSKMAHRDTGMGYGWGNTCGWEIEVRRSQIILWNEQGIAVDFPMIPEGGEAIGPWGWVLRREDWGFAVDADDGIWHLFSAPDPDGSRYRLTAIEDRNRNRISFTYEDGRLVEITDSAGRVIRVRTTPEGRIEAFEVKNAVAQGRWVAMVTYAYDDGHLISATDADGYASYYQYGNNHLLTQDTDRTGLTFHFCYDNQSRCIESWGDYPGRRDPSLIDGLPKYLYDGKTRVKGIHHCRFNYYDHGYSEVDDSTQARCYFGTPHGTLSKSVEGGGAMTAAYHDDGHLLARTDPMGATTSFERDVRGRILQVTDPLGRVTKIQRDAAGLPIEVIDSAGGVTTILRDRCGNVEEFKDAAGAVTSFKRDKRGLIAEILWPSGHRTTFAHDDHGNLGLVTLPNGATWRYLYDGIGRRLAEIDPQGAETRYAYSARGDLIAVHDPAGGVTRFSYDGEAHLTEIVDPKGGVTQLSWGGYHKLCARKDANGNEVLLRYSLEGELVEVHNERREVHRLEYNPAGRLIGEITFDGREIRYRHDRCGRVIRIESGRPYKKTHLEYDLSGQLIKRELWDDTSESFEYSALGDIIAAHWPSGEVRFERDAVGRIVCETQKLGQSEQRVEIAYDTEGQRIGRKTSLGHVEAIERDAIGARRRTTLDGAHVIEHQSDPWGREIARMLPGGGRIESAYDVMGRLAQRRALGPTIHRPVGAGEPDWIGPRAENITVAKSYRYDLTGELVEALDRHEGRTEYRYDPIGQLLMRVPEKARAEVFRFDLTGNLHEAGPEAEPREYGKGNRLLRKGEAEYVWDDDGRLIEKHLPGEGGRKQVWRYAWNDSGLLQSATLQDGTIIQFAYDPFARRVLKQVSKPKTPGDRPALIFHTRFIWDGDVLVHELKRTSTENGDPVVEVKTYCFEDESFEPLAHNDGRLDETGRLEKGEWFHYVNDPNGTPERLLAADGKVACELDRTAWGLTAVVKGSRTRTQFRFQGQYEDEEIGLCYNRHRYYAPDIGIFICADPIRLRGGLHSFAYRRNPIAYSDPLGLIPRREAIRRAQRHAQVPRDSRGGQDIPLTELNPSSRGKNWLRQKIAGGKSSGRKCDPEQRRGDPRQWMDHPDGHPDAGQPGIPAHHASPHIHATNQKGEEIAIPYDP
jgi:RHS repeat-associated protein